MSLTPDIIRAASEKPVVAGAELEVAPNPEITGSRKTRPILQVRSTQAARPASPVIIGGDVDKPTIR